MALSGSEAIFVKAMILHGSKQRAVREAFPKLEAGFEAVAIRYLYQNPEVQRNIDAGILYLYRDIVPHADVPIPQPLSTKDKINLLQMVVNGERETPTYIVTNEGLRLIFSEPSEQEIEEAKVMMRELKLADKMEWVF